MDRPRCQNHRNSNPACRLVLIRQDDVLAAGPHSLFSFPANALERVFQSGALGGHVRCVKSTVDGLRTKAKTLDQPLIHPRSQNRAFQHKHFLLGFVCVQHITQVLEARAQAHHPAFPQRIDRRVGHLAEILPEEMAHRPVSHRQNGRRRIVSHRADGFLATFGHGRQDQFQCFQRIAGRRFAAQQLLLVEQHRLWPGANFRFQLSHRLQPFLIRRLRGEEVDNLAMVVEFAGAEVGCDHSACGYRAPAGDLVIAQRAHARFGANCENTVRRQSIAQRAQTIPVKPSHCPAPIIGRNGGRPVPRLHHGIAIVIKRAVGDRHDRIPLRPGFRDQHRFGHRRRAAGFAEQFPDRIQRAGIRCAIRDHWLHVLCMIAKSLRDHADFMALHPVTVAAERVDLAIMRNCAEGLSQRPLRECVR